MPRSLFLCRIAATAILLTVGVTGHAFAAEPSLSVNVEFAPGSPAPPVLDEPYSYALNLAVGAESLQNLVVVDYVAVEIALSHVTTGSYTGLGDFAPGEGVRVSYEKNTAPGVFTLWGSSPNAQTNTTLTNPPPGLGAGEYVTRVRREYGTAAAGMRPSATPVLAGRVTNPDNAGGPVALGTQINNCAEASATADGPRTVTSTSCRWFDLMAGPAVALDAPDSVPLGTATHATATLSGGGDATGSLFFRVYAADDAACTTALSEEEVAVDGLGSYTAADFTAPAAGAYKWVARYDGDALHAAAATGCNDPAGAFTVVAPPTVSAAFGAAAITAGEATSLTYTITNPAANTVPLTGVALQNTLPDGVAVASPNGVSGSCGAGTIDAVPGSQTVALTGGTIAVGSSCSFAVDVTASTPGTVTTTTSAAQSANGGTGNAATASLTVQAPPAPPVTPASPTPRPVPPTPVSPPHVLTARELAVSCSPDWLVVRSVRIAGHRVRLQGLARTADAGQRVTIRALPAGTVAARATVRTDGSFAATARLPHRRAIHTTRYVADLGQRHSPTLKLTRRLSARLAAGSGTLTIRGRVTPPLDTPVRRVVIRQRTSCAGGYGVIASVKPGADGRFRVTIPHSAGPALYRLRTRVQTKPGGRIQTSSLVLAHDPGRTPEKSYSRSQAT